jgi:hypothetical protein
VVGADRDDRDCKMFFLEMNYQWMARTADVYRPNYLPGESIRQLVRGAAILHTQGLWSVLLGECGL